MDKKSDNSSWQLISENIAIKQTDISSLKYNEIRITNDVRSFFEFEEAETYERREINLIFNSVKYECVLYMDAHSKKRSKLRWGRMFRGVFHSLISGYFFGEGAEEVRQLVNPPLMRFEKIDLHNYKINFVFNKEIIQNSIEYDIDALPLKDKYIAYENNIMNKIEVLKHHGPICTVCGFDYLQVYGDIGKGKEEIHMLKDPSDPSFDPEKLDCMNDFTTVCSNCHKILHQDYDYEELKFMVKMNDEIKKTFKTPKGKKSK